MQIIVNAADFGIWREGCDAIISAYYVGAVSSTTLMVNMDAASAAAAMAAKKPGLGVGLHFNLTLGSPLEKPETIPSLVNKKGVFLDRRQFVMRALLGRIRPEDIRREFEAQVARFSELVGPMTHVDSHQHVHCVPVVFDVLAEWASRNSVPVRMPWFPIDKTGGERGIRHARRAVLMAMLARNRKKWKGRLNVNAGFGSV